MEDVSQKIPFSVCGQRVAFFSHGQIMRFMSEAVEIVVDHCLVLAIAYFLNLI